MVSTAPASDGQGRRESVCTGGWGGGRGRPSIGVAGGGWCTVLADSPEFPSGMVAKNVRPVSFMKYGLPMHPRDKQFLYKHKTEGQMVVRSEVIPSNEM